jgi:hypothetical protein
MSVRLDRFQLSVVDSPQNASLSVAACPGSGKSTTLACRHLPRARLAAVARHRQLNDMTERSPAEGWTPVCESVRAVSGVW